MTAVAEVAQRGAFLYAERVDKIGDGRDHRGDGLDLDGDVRALIFLSYSARGLYDRYALR